MTEPAIVIAQLWQWTCDTCRDPEDPNVPGAYGDGDTYGEVAAQVKDHLRERHPDAFPGVPAIPADARARLLAEHRERRR